MMFALALAIGTWCLALGSVVIASGILLGLSRHIRAKTDSPTSLPGLPGMAIKVILLDLPLAESIKRLARSRGVPERELIIGVLRDTVLLQSMMSGDFPTPKAK
jgi:hypothetical protein